MICDVHDADVGGHVLLLIGFDRNRQVFQAKNSWGEGAFIEIAYANDPNWQIGSGWYITDVVDPTFVQNEACWLGNWRADRRELVLPDHPATVGRFRQPRARRPSWAPPISVTGRTT